MRDLLHRSFTPDLEVRSGGDGRTIYGIAVPWESPQRIDETLVEQFARGAFNHQLRAANRVRFSREHLTLGGSLIGRMSMMRDDAAGLYVELRASKTPLGDETLELVRDGALRDLSIGFQARQNRRLPAGVLERVTADLVEVAVTMEGAYGELATAAGVRSAAGEATASCDRPCCRSAGLEEARLVLAGLPALSCPAAARRRRVPHPPGTVDLIGRHRHPGIGPPHLRRSLTRTPGTAR